MLKGFRDFIMRGNVIDLAVAVVIGAAFTTVVNAIVNGLFTPLVSALFNAKDLDSALKVTIPGTEATLLFGHVLAAIISFVLIAAVVYFVFVLPINRMKALQDQAPVDAEKTELDMLTEIRDLLSRRNV